MTNEERAEALIRALGFDFAAISKERIQALLQREIEDFQEGSSEYIRLLCGYLFCLGDAADVSLLEKAKYGVNFDVGCMVDGEWIDSLKNGGRETELVHPRKELVQDFVSYYQDYQADDGGCERQGPIVPLDI